MQYVLCSDCDYCKTDRKNEQGQVRCTKFSQFVNPDDMGCKDFHKEIHGAKEFRDFFENLEMRG